MNMLQSKYLSREIGTSAKGTQGIVNVDRYAGYFALLGPDWSLKLAYCWSHQRRDFVNVVEVAD